MDTSWTFCMQKASTARISAPAKGRRHDPMEYGRYETDASGQRS